MAFPAPSNSAYTGIGALTNTWKNSDLVPTGGGNMGGGWGAMFGAQALGSFANSLFAPNTNQNPQVLGNMPTAPTITQADIVNPAAQQANFAATSGMAQSGLGIGSDAYQGPTAQSLWANQQKVMDQYKGMAQEYGNVANQMAANNQTSSGWENFAKGMRGLVGL
jgi:hypothetical protein